MSKIIAIDHSGNHLKVDTEIRHIDGRTYKYLGVADDHESLLVQSTWDGITLAIRHEFFGVVLHIDNGGLPSTPAMVPLLDQQISRIEHDHIETNFNTVRRAIFTTLSALTERLVYATDRYPSRDILAERKGPLSLERHADVEDLLSDLHRLAFAHELLVGDRDAKDELERIPATIIPATEYAPASILVPNKHHEQAVKDMLDHIVAAYPHHATIEVYHTISPSRPEEDCIVALGLPATDIPLPEIDNPRFWED